MTSAFAPEMLSAIHEKFQLFLQRRQLIERLDRIEFVFQLETLLMNRF